MSIAIPEAPMRAEEIETGALTPRVLTGEIVPVRPTIDLPSESEWRVLSHMANSLAESGILGRNLNGRPKAVMAVLLKGRELGVPQMMALQSIYIIEGVPTLSALLMNGLVQRAGHRLWCEETSATKCVMVAQRRDIDGTLLPEQRVTWTIEDARRAELQAKDNWRHYPAAMLVSRATSQLCRMVFADVLMGAVYTPEEFGAQVDGSGAVVALPTKREAVRAARSFGREEPTEDLPRQEPARDLDGSPLPDHGLAPDTVDQEPDEPEQALDRTVVWAELTEQARLLGKSVQQHLTRAIAQHKRNPDQMTTRQLADFVASRRTTVEAYVEQHPDAVDREPVGTVPECPADPEAPPVTDEEATPDTTAPEPEADPE